jgi:RNA polymerase sigma-70 factor (ECF subfamily)
MPKPHLSHDLPSDSLDPPASGVVRRSAAAPRAAQQSWADLYQNNASLVLSYLRRLVGRTSTPSAEDLTHEVFLVAFANWKTFRGSSAISSWLCGIAFNLARRHLLKEATATRALAQLALCGFGMSMSGELLPEAMQLYREQQSALLSAAMELPSTLQEAFVLHFVAGLSNEEAASELGVSKGNFRVRVARARSLIRARLEQSRLIE